MSKNVSRQENMLRALQRRSRAKHERCACMACAVPENGRSFRPAPLRVQAQHCQFCVAARPDRSGAAIRRFEQAVHKGMGGSNNGAKVAPEENAVAAT